MTFTLRPFQTQGRDWLVAHPRAILADPMGLGKTPQAVAMCAVTQPTKVIVVAPPRTVDGWRRHFDLIWPADFDVAISPAALRARMRPSILDPMVTFVPWSRLSNAPWSRRVLNAEGCTLIIDEAHLAKEPSSARTRAAWRLARQAKRVAMLTATPILSRPIEMQQALQHGCRAGDWATRTAYGDRYCRRFSPFADRGYDYLGAQNTDALARKVAPYVLRREIEDVAPDMPGVTAIEIDLGLNMPRELKALEDDQSQWAALANATEDHVKLPYGITFGTYKRLVAMAKAKAVAKWCKEQQEPLLLFGHHREAQLLIAKELGTTAIVGGTGATITKQVVGQFMQGELPVLVAGMKVLGTGFDGLQKSCSAVVFAEPGDTPGEMDQAIGRVRRIGAASDMVRAFFLTAARSSDAYRYKQLAEKSEVIAQVLGAST